MIDFTITRMNLKPKLRYDMSFNISRFKLKEFKNLRIPVEALFPKGAENYHPERVNNDDGSTEFILSPGGGLAGVIDDEGYLNVNDVGDITDDGSGYVMEDILIPALKQSTGAIVFTLIWESGEHIESIVVNNGDIHRITIDV